MTFNSKLSHRKSIRLKGHDYSQKGLYFITICCHEKKHLFGKIINKKMILNDAGIHAKKCWLEIPSHFTNVILHEYIIMPNHIHGIIELVGANQNSPDIVFDEKHSNDISNSIINTVTNQYSPDIVFENNQTSVISKNSINSFTNQYSADMNKNEHVNVNVNNGAKNINLCNGAKNISPLRSPSKTIGSVVRGFKIGVTKWFRQNTKTHDVWQRNYYDIIIQNEKSYFTISEYIENNPLKWNNDTFFN